MRWLRWFLRRDLVVADAALVGGIAAAGIGVIGRIVVGEDAPAAGALRILGVFAIVYGVVWILLYAWLSHPWEPEDRFVFSHVAKRLADAAVGMVLFIGYQVGQPRSSPMWEPPSSVIIGIPIGNLVFFAGAAMVAIGWIWIRLIARGEPEPEANDRFWWSRA